MLRQISFEGSCLKWSFKGDKEEIILDSCRNGGEGITLQRELHVSRFTSEKMEHKI